MSMNSSLSCPVADVLHGVPVYDPYRWLEDRALPETNQWIQEQRKRCEAYYSACDPFEMVRSRVEAFLNVEIVDQPARVGDLCFYRRRKKNQEQACIYMREEGGGIERLLVDPSAEGPFTWVGIHRISEDASLLAFEVKRSGGDRKEIRIVNTQSGRLLPDRIARGYARGFAFSPFNDGFYYCQESGAHTEEHSIRFHSFLRPSEDRLVFVRAGAAGCRLVVISDAVHLGAIWIHGGSTTGACDLFIASFEQDRDWRPVFTNRTLPYTPFLALGRIYVLSCERAPNGQLIELTRNGRELRTVVPERDTPPRQIVIAGGRFFASYLTNGCPSIRSWSLEGGDTRDIDIPSDGSIQLLPQLGPPADSFFYTHESFAQPPTIYECWVRTETSLSLHESATSRRLEGCEVRSSSYVAKDGAEIPITLVARSGSSHLRPQPAIMTGYGGFCVPMAPQFSVLATIMMEFGAVFALPHIRGGGEFGKSWHDAGRVRNRLTAISDFLSAAEWLFSEGITVPSKLAIFGGSNSGLLVGAAMTQRPSHFRAVLCIAPLLDMVRYERFDQAAKWQAEYGSADVAEDFHALYAYSPYHHVLESVDYPATLFVSGDSDDRCNPAHVRKMAALLQGRPAQRNPVLVDYSAERGHSPVMPLSVRIDALARRLAFLCAELKIDIFREARHETANR